MKCDNPASGQNLLAGLSLAAVFNNTPDVSYSRILLGDAIQYLLELENQLMTQ